MTNMHASKISKASPPSWKMTLLNVCSLINNLNSPAEEAGEMHEDDLVGKRKLPVVLDGFSLEAMLTIFQLQKICHSRAFQHWEIIQEDILDNGNEKTEKEEVIKRKIPYILKRQLYENKPRRIPELEANCLVILELCLRAADYFFSPLKSVLEQNQ